MVAGLRTVRIDGDARTLTPTVSLREGANALIAVEGPLQEADWRFIQHAKKIFASDPRIASVSRADAAVHMLAAGRGRVRLPEPISAEGFVAFAAQPVGSLIVVNPRVLPLVENLQHHGGVVTSRAVREWSASANVRGLRHVWSYSGAWDESRPLILPGPVDAIEAQDPSSAIGYLVDRHRASFCALSINVDASWLGPSETGAQVALVEWLKALAARDDVERLTLFRLPSRHLPGYAQALACTPKVHILNPKENPSPADVFWRPNQPNQDASAFVDRRFGRRVAATVLDLIRYSNQRYHFDSQWWQMDRRVLRRYLLEADMVTGISQDVVDHLRQEVPGLEASGFAERLWVLSI